MVDRFGGMSISDGGVRPDSVVIDGEGEEVEEEGAELEGLQEEEESSGKIDVPVAMISITVIQNAAAGRSSHDSG